MAETQLAETACISREQAIQQIRSALLRLVDDDHSVCEFAAEKGILCRGFRRFTDEELRECYYWLAHRAKSRQELEDLANRWQLARQILHEVPLSCDVQTIEHDVCRGWDGVTNEDLSRYCRELLGISVTVI